MGFLDTLRGVNSTTLEPQITAAYENPFLPNWWSTSLPRISRQRALTVPAIARARNLIAGTCGALPLHRYNRFDNTRLAEIPLQLHPDPQHPASVTWSYIFDSLMFYGVSYCQVISQYQDGRIQHFRWLDPSLIQENVDHNNQVVGYNYDGKDMPTSGVGRVIIFESFEDGVLSRGGRTIETAIELEEAASRAAKEPMPQVILKNEGVDLPASKIQDILAGWKAARRERATAYLNASMKIETVGYTSSENQLVEARQFHSTELARLMNIPPHFLGSDYAQSMTYANVETERRNMVDLSLKPYLVAVEGRLNMPDFSSRSEVFRFDMDSFIRGNAKERVEITKTLLEMGIISVEEAREMEDLSPRGNEDETRI